MSDYIQRHYNQNILLSKDNIGKSKNIGYQVPSDMTFGKKCYQNGRDSAKDSVNSWVASNPTKRAQKIQDFVQSNIIQANNKKNDVQKVYKEKKLGCTDLKMNLPDTEFIYGKPSWQDQNMNKIIQQEYKKESEQYVSQYYIELENRVLNLQLEKIRYEQKQIIRTKSLAPKIVHSPNIVVEKDLFKMKKFQQINSKYKQDEKIDWKDVLNVKK